MAFLEKRECEWMSKIRTFRICLQNTVMILSYSWNTVAGIFKPAVSRN